MFNENQLKELSKNLDKSRIKIRDKSGISLQYLETYDVINEANRIFNHMWSYTITRLEEVAREMNQNSNHVITFSAIVKIKINDSTGNLIEREDTGVGIGTARTIGDAIDNASKSAVSDSLKRCFRTMGVTFGNNLYSKSQNENQQNQNYNQIQQRPPQNNQQLQQPYQNENVNSRATNSNFKGIGNQQQTARQNQAQSMQQQVQNSNGNVNNRTTQNANQKPLQHNQQNNPQQNSFSNNQSFDQYEYQSLYNLGLEILEQNGFLIIIGENQYAYRDAIKASNFRFDAKSKTWYKPIESAA